MLEVTKDTFEPEVLQAEGYSQTSSAMVAFHVLL